MPVASRAIHALASYLGPLALRSLCTLCTEYLKFRAEIG
jgi:hypothetical protein